MHIKILGPGCHSCQTLEQATREAMDQLRVDALIEHVTDFDTQRVAATPTLLVDEAVLVAGRVPHVDELKELLVEAGADA